MNLESIYKNLVKALMADFVLKVGIYHLTGRLKWEPYHYVDSVAGAFTAFTIRELCRKEYPLLGGIIGGTIKYAVKDSYALAGAVNNLAYEALMGSDLDNHGLAPILIEGSEAVLVNCYQKFNNTAMEKLYCIAEEFGRGAMVGVMLVGIGPAYKLLTSYHESISAFLTIPASVGLVSYTSYRLYEKVTSENFTSEVANLKTSIESRYDHFLEDISVILIASPDGTESEL